MGSLNLRKDQDIESSTDDENLCRVGCKIVGVRSCFSFIVKREMDKV